MPRVLFPNEKSDLDLGRKQIEMLTSRNLLSRNPEGGFVANASQKEILDTIAADPPTMVCDFCGDSPVRYENEATDFTFGKFGADVHNSLGSWMACSVCQTFIYDKDKEGLMRRSLKRYLEKNMVESSAEAVLAGAAIEGAHKMFWEHSNGKVTRI